MGAQLTAWGTRIDALSLRERAILLFVSLLVLYLVCDQLFISPVLQGLQQNRIEVTELQSKLAALELRAAQLGSGRQDPDEQRHARIAELEIALAEQHTKFEQHLGQLVQPQRAARLLQDILQQDHDLRLLHLDTAPGAPFLSTTQQTARIVRYDLNLGVEGDYGAMLGYLERLEKLPWTLFWSDFELEVKEYPHNVARLSVYTLGQRS